MRVTGPNDLKQNVGRDRASVTLSDFCCIFWARFGNRFGDPSFTSRLYRREVGSLWAGRSLLSIAGQFCGAIGLTDWARGRLFLMLAFLGASLCQLGMFLTGALPWALATFFVVLGFFMSGVVVMVDGLVLQMLSEGQHHKYIDLRLSLVG